MPVDPTAKIHPTAVLDGPCDIGPGTRIWHFAHIREGAVIGANCIIGQGAYVGAGVRIGDRCKVQNHVSIYEGVTLEDEVFVGPSAVFTNVINPRAAIERKHEIRPTLLRRGATIGANATVVCGVEIGRWAFVAAGSVVTRNILDFERMIGVPGRHRGWICRCGITLDRSLEVGAEAKCPDCGARYRLAAAETPGAPPALMELTV